MPDFRFFQKPTSSTLGEIASLAGCELAPGADSSYRVKDVAPLDKAGLDHLSFLDNVRYKEQFLASKAGACIVDAARAEFAPSGMNVLISKSPYKSYALAAQHFYPLEQKSAKISEHAIIHPTAQIGMNACIEEGAVIREGVIIGEDTHIESYAVIERNVEIGKSCRIGTHASVSHALIGDHVRLYPGVRIGQDGFGFVPGPDMHLKIPQLGRVIIEDHVEIGANTAIDRGSGPDTVIGQGTWIDNLVQIGHNVKIGKGCIIVAQVGISGSTIIEDYAALGGQSGVAGHLRVGQGARIGAQSGVIRDVPAGEEHMGMPSVPTKQFMRQFATLNRLIKPQKKP